MSPILSITKKASLTGHSGSVYTIAQFGDSGLLSGSGDGLVVSWNINKPEEGEIVARIPGVIYSLLVINEKLFVGQAAGGIHVVNITERKEERLLKYHDAGIFSLLYVPYHQLIFSLAGDGMLGVMDAQSLTLQNKLLLGTGKLRAATVSPNNKVLAAGTGDGSIYTFLLPELKPLKHFQAHQEGYSVNAVRFTPDGKFLLSGSRDAHLNIFDAENDYNLKQSIPAHNYAIYSIEYSPDNKLIATGSRDKTVKIWDANTFEMLHRIDKEKNDGHVNSVNKILWLPNIGSEIRGFSGAGSGDPARQHTEAGESTYCLISASDDRSVMVWGIQ